MIEGVAAVAGVEAVAIAAGAASSRQSIERRRRRLRWLASLARAQGEPDAQAGRLRDEALLADNRERIAAALDTIEELGRLGGSAAEADGEAPAGAISAADIARRIAAQGPASLLIQARLGAASVRRLVAPENEVNGINRL